MKIPYKCTNYLAVVEKTVRKKRKIFLTFVCRYSRIHKTKKHQSVYKSCLNSPTLYFRSRLRNISPIVFPRNGKRLSSPQSCHVPFRAKAFLHGHRRRLHNNEPQDYEIKDISTLLDSTPVLRRPQLRFWEWLADYYLCTVGDVIQGRRTFGIENRKRNTNLL